MTDINNTFFQFTAMTSLVVFYLIYIGKMLLQKRKGIQTDQMAKGEKPKNLLRTEWVMKIATYSIVIVEILSIFHGTTLLYIPFRVTGAVLSSIGVIIFGISVYTMRDSWRAGIPQHDKTDLVTTGIFKISRNPSFLAFDLVYLGILFMFFNVILLLFTVWAIIMLHLQIKQEEKYLTVTFGEPYLQYKRKTRRYIGNNICK